MANWKENITIKVRLPHQTQGGTIAWDWKEFKIDRDSCYYYGHCNDCLKWVCDNLYNGDEKLIIIGKAHYTRNRDWNFTTFKVQAGLAKRAEPYYRGYKFEEEYKVKVLSYN